MKNFIVSLLLLSSVNAFADQCQLVSKTQAKKAVAALQASAAKTGGMLGLCQNCGETEPTQTRINQLDIQKSGTLSEVNVNGVGIDLAYTYVMVKPSDKRWVNLAKVAKCDHTGASDFIYEVKNADGSIDFVPSTVERE